MSASANGRLESLDGLRGLAALVVVVHHSLLTMPGFSAVYWGLPVPQFAQPLAYTPLHILWAGGEAVLVFFVLSGVVLTLPFLQNTRRKWIAYFPSRLIRIYVPVAASVAIALIATALWPRVFGTEHGDWLRAHEGPVTPLSALRDVFLLSGTGWLNSPLWSLRWEVVFSLLLPLYVWGAVRFRRQWWLVGAVLMALSAIGTSIGSDALRLLPLFGFGCMIATWVPRLVEVAQHRERPLAARWGVPSALLCAAVLSITAHWWLGARFGGAIDFVANLLVYGGVVLIVVLAIACRPVVRFFRTRALVFLGSISFSVYLVHEPLIVSLATVVPTTHSWVVPLLGIPLSLVAGWLFFRAVEKGSHRIARRVRTRLSKTSTRDDTSTRRNAGTRGEALN